MAKVMFQVRHINLVHSRLQGSLEGFRCQRFWFFLRKPDIEKLKQICKKYNINHSEALRLILSTDLDRLLKELEKEVIE